MEKEAFSGLLLEQPKKVAEIRLQGKLHGATGCNSGPFEWRSLPHCIKGKSMEKPVITIWHKITSTPVPSADSFTLRTDRKHVWLQRIALWVLAKLDARKVEQVIACTRIGIDPADFMTKLSKSRHAVRDICGRTPDLLLLGAEEFEEMMGCPAIYNMVQFDAPYRGGINGRPIVMNMRVCVIPWMRGAVPLMRRDLA